MADEAAGSASGDETLEQPAGLLWETHSRRQRLRGVALRIALPIVFIPVVVAIASEKGLLLSCLAIYLLLALVGAAMEMRGFLSSVRINVFLVLDTALILSSAYASGLQTSPILSLLGTLVIAYTLQRGIRTGLVAIVLVAVLFGVGLILESAGLVPVAPLVPPGQEPLAMAGGPVGAWLITAIALVSATWLLNLSIGRVESQHLALNRTIAAEQSAVEEAAKVGAHAHEVQRLESLGRMAGGMAHEFNNLLTVILGYSRLVAEDLDDPEGQSDMMQVAQAANRGKQLVSQLLSYSQQRPGEFEILDLPEFITSSVAVVQHLLRADIRLRTDLDVRPIRVRADRLWMEQVLVNLVTNAVDSMPDGGDLTLSARLETEAVARLAVSDTGRGMDAAVCRAAQDAFFTTKPPGEGTGLGLAVVREVVENHGGSIRIDSAPGRGTEVSVRLPIVEGEPPRRDPTETEVEGGDETILLVEDERLVRDVAQRALARLGYQTLVAEDAEEAEAIFERDPNRIDLLLTDVVLPGRSGRELADRFRAARPDLPVLFTSGYSDDILAKLGFSGDKVDFLRKPFTIQDLARKARALMADEAGK